MAISGYVCSKTSFKIRSKTPKIVDMKKELK